MREASGLVTGFRVEGRFGQAGDGGCLGQCQVSRGSVVVNLGRSAHAVRPMSKKDLVQVQFQNFVLAEFLLNAQSEKNLAQFADEMTLPSQVEVAGQLHGDGAAALTDPSAARKIYGGADQGLQIHSEMLLKARIFGRDEGLAHRQWDFVQTDGNASLGAVYRKQCTILGVNPKRGLQMNIAKFLDRRHAGLDV